MSAFTGFRDTAIAEGGAVPQKLYFPVAASTHIQKGALVALSSGYLVEASTATGLICVGRAEQDVDNSAGSAGALSCEVRRGVLNLVMSTASSDTPAQANAMANVYAVDNQTVGILSSGKSVAGKLIELDPDGVSCWVQVGV